MIKNRLHTLYGQLDDTEALAHSEWWAMPVPETPPFWLAKDADGHVALMVEWGPDGPPEGLTNWRAGQVYHKLPRSHQIHRSDTGAKETLSVSFLVLKSDDDPETVSNYLNLLYELLVEPAPDVPTAEQSQWIADTIEGLRGLFHRTSKPNEKTIIGLWGELYALKNSSDPARAGKAWHLDPERIDDFRDGDQRIDVKTTVGEIREHEMRLNQLQALTHICSVWVEKNPNGDNITDLLAEIGHALRKEPSSLLHRIRKIVYKTIGNPYQPAVAGMRLCELENEDALKLYPIVGVPSVKASAAVRKVVFLSDLSGVDALTDSETMQEGGLLGHWKVRSRPQPD